MIRVLELLTTTTLGGGPQQVRHLVRHLPAGEFEVAVAGPWERGLAEQLRALHIEPAALALGTLRGLPLTLRRTIRLIRSAKADVVHTHGKGAGFYGRLAAWLAGVPAVHTFHGIHYESYSQTGQRAYLALERRLVAITHTVINVSASQEVEALALGVARAERSVVVVNGIDVDELAARSPVARAQLGLSDAAQVVGCVARFDPVKRHDALVRAFALVAPRRPNLSLLLVGDGPERARIAALAADLGIAPDRIVAPGELAWTTNAYSCIDLYVATSRKEGLPLAPFTVHDLRRTASTLLNELGFNSDWIEKCLAHEDGRSSRGVYNKAEYEVQRRHMMQEWSNIVDAWVGGQKYIPILIPPSMPLLQLDPAL